MKKTLSTKKEVTLKDMSIDDMDYCNDLQHICQEPHGGISIYGLNKSNTAWIRRGVEGSDDEALIDFVEGEHNAGADGQAKIPNKKKQGTKF